MSEADDYLDAAPALPTLPGAHVRLTMADIHADGTDDGIAPDWQPAAGEHVTLTPVGIKSNSLLVYDAAGSQPIVARVQPVRCMIGKHGWLVKKDADGVERPVWILATDDPLLSVTGWLWRATIADNAFNFPAPTDGTVELADFITAPALEPDVQTWVGRIPELVDAAGGLVSISSITEDAGEVVITLSNGSQSRLPLPKGEPGADGRGVESITDDDEDGIATVLFTDGATGALPLPRGPQGDPAPPPEIAWAGDVLTVDGVSSPPLSGPAGPAPVTSWSGTSLIVGDNPPVNLQGPVGARGPVGSPGAVATASDFLLVGPGRPDTPATTGGVVTGSEPVGAEYRSTDGAGVGAWVWMKRSTGWRVTDGDTGWRKVPFPAGSYPSEQFFSLRRVGPEVSITQWSSIANWNAPATTNTQYSVNYQVPLPTGFRSLVQAGTEVREDRLNTAGKSLGGLYVALNVIRWWNTGSVAASFALDYKTADAWPTTLPGTPA